MRPALPNPLGDLPGARESNAGDEFHILWGVSLCLRMIRPDSPLHSVLIEGVSPIDRTGASGRSFLAADITEYYGGNSFEQATVIESANSLAQRLLEDLVGLQRHLVAH